MGVKGLFRDMLSPGSTITILGERGKGKTWLAVVLTDFFLRDLRPDEERYALTNLFYMKRVPKTQAEKAALGERFKNIEVDPDEFVLKYPNRVIPARNLAEAIKIASEKTMDAKKRGMKIVRFLWVCDEAGIAFSSGTHFMSKQASGFKQFLSIQRKFGLSSKGDDGGMTSVFIFPEESMVLGSIRAEKTSTVKATLSKDPADIAKFASHLLRAEYNQKQIVVLIYPRFCDCRRLGGAHQIGCHGVEAMVVGESPHAKPLDEVHMGEIVYSPGSPASFDIISPHPAAPDKMFKPDEFWRVMSSVLETKAPELMYRYFHSDPDMLPEVQVLRLHKKVAEEDRATEDERRDEPDRTDAEKIVARLITAFKQGIDDNREAAREAECTPRWAQIIRKRWERGCYTDEGKRTDVSLD